MINISQSDFESINYYAERLKKEPDAIVHEALKLYFEAQEKLFEEQGILDKDTKLDFDEFWDGIELD